MPRSISQMRAKRSILFAVLILIYFIPKAALSLTFNDGGIHHIDYHIDGNVSVYNNVNPPYGPTTVNLLSGSLYYLFAAENSIINISGGSALSLTASDETILTMTGGFVGSSAIHLEDNSKMFFHGGGIDGFFVRDNAELEMTGGEVLTGFGLEGGTAIIDGGLINGSFVIHGHANVTISEVTATWEFSVIGDATVTIYGGEFGETYFHGDSIVKIYGGKWRDIYRPRFSGNSSVTICGYGFNVPIGTYTTDNNLDYLSGFFSDGSPFEFDSRPSPMLKDGATITLVLEPTITVISPNNGEVLSAGKSHAITWTSKGNIENVKIEYSVNNGTDWIEIVDSTDNDCSFDWEVPNNPSEECLVRISDVDGDPYDLSDAVFSIEIGGPLLFTAVPPCRIVDTRKAGGAISSGNIRSYNVRGNVLSQGGNSSGCPSPEGEPHGVHVNITAVPVVGSGNFRAYPFDSVPPNASFINYKTGIQNIANSGAIKTCFNCAKDISIQSNFGTAHLVMDVLGYYNTAP